MPLLRFSWISTLLLLCSCAHKTMRHPQKGFAGNFENTAFKTNNAANVPQLTLAEKTATAFPAPEFLSKSTKEKMSVVKRHVRIGRSFLLPPDSLVKDSIPKPLPPYEKHAKLGFIFTMAGIVAIFIPYVGLLALPLLIAGMVLGIIGWRNIKDSPGKFRGKGLAGVAIGLPIGILLLFLAILIIYIVIILAILGTL